MTEKNDKIHGIPCKGRLGTCTYVWREGVCNICPECGTIFDKKPTKDTTFTNE